MTDTPKTVAEKAAAWDAYWHCHSEQHRGCTALELADKVIAAHGINWRDFMPKPEPRVVRGMDYCPAGDWTTTVHLVVEGDRITVTHIHSHPGRREKPFYIPHSEAMRAYREEFGSDEVKPEPAHDEPPEGYDVDEIDGQWGWAKGCDCASDTTWTRADAIENAHEHAKRERASQGEDTSERELYLAAGLLPQEPTLPEPCNTCPPDIDDYKWHWFDNILRLTLDGECVWRCSRDYVVDVGLSEVYREALDRVSDHAAMSRPEPCPECNGSGVSGMMSAIRCPVCRGEGAV